MEAPRLQQRLLVAPALLLIVASLIGALTAFLLDGNLSTLAIGASWRHPLRWPAASPPPSTRRAARPTRCARPPTNRSCRPRSPACSTR